MHVTKVNATCLGACKDPGARYPARMFTIEHEFDASIITLVDDMAAPGTEDITIAIFDDQVTIEQVDPHTERLQKIALSMRQIADLRAALDLPEGAYVRRPGGG